MHVVRGLRQALLMQALAAAVAAAAAGVWTAARGGPFVPALGLALMVLAGLVSVTGGTELTRGSTMRGRALLGAAPERGAAYTGEALTAAGVFLLVALPLFLVGGFLRTAG